MVEDSLSDGTRIAQLLSSELTGLAVGPLNDVAVTGAKSNVEPTAEGALAYEISHEGTVVGAVYVTPSAARLAFEESVGVATTASSAVADAGQREDLALLQAEDGPLSLRIESGAAVKAAVDVVRAVLADG